MEGEYTVNECAKGQEVCMDVCTVLEFQRLYVSSGLWLCLEMKSSVDSACTVDTSSFFVFLTHTNNKVLGKQK